MVKRHKAQATLDLLVSTVGDSVLTDPKDGSAPKEHRGIHRQAMA